MILECTLALLSFTICLHRTEYTHKMEKKRRYETEVYNQKLKLSGFNSVFQTRIPKIRLSILETNSCIFIILSPFCMRVLSLSFFSFLLQLLCTNMKKVAVQPSLQYKQAETKDSTECHKNWHSDEKWALQVKSHCQRLRHTNVVFVKFTR